MAAKSRKYKRVTTMPTEGAIMDLQQTGSFEAAGAMHGLTGRIDPVADQVQKVWRKKNRVNKIRRKAKRMRY